MQIIKWWLISPNWQHVIKREIPSVSSEMSANCQLGGHAVTACGKEIFIFFFLFINNTFLTNEQRKYLNL